MYVTTVGGILIQGKAHITPFHLLPQWLDLTDPMCFCYSAVNTTGVRETLAAAEPTSTYLSG